MSDTVAAAPLLAQQQLVELLELVNEADSVELKLSVDGSQQRSAVEALGPDPLDRRGTADEDAQGADVLLGAAEGGEVMRCELYMDAYGKHRRRMVSSNGRTVASSGQRSSTRSNARRAVFNVRDNGAAATIS
jgi:uncharacterized protein YegP (UPF0339 family)